MGKDKPADRASRLFNERLRQGGQRLRMTGSADLYQRRGPTAERINVLGRTVRTRAILSSRIHLSNYLRGVGNIYGAYVEEMQAGPSGDFLREFVDGGKVASGGITPHLLEVSDRVRIARAALAELPPLRHRAKRQPGSGRHEAMTHRQLIDAVCVQGDDLAYVAIEFGWYVRKPQKDGAGPVCIPKQQSQKLKAGLEAGLEAIEAAWRAASIDVSRIIGGLEVG
jgi:hypothetical protein